MPPPQQSSDPFDDDDFFDDPSTLAAIAQAEERAIAASQAPKRSGYHHTVSRPAAGPRSTQKPPQPINTNPRVSNCGFGWEQGGKHSERMAQGLPVSGMARYNRDEAPTDVVLDHKGQYGFGSAEDEPIYDQRQRPEIRQMVEAAAREKEAPPRTAKSQVQGSQARREALAAALPPRAPITRTTSANAVAGPSSTQPARLGARTFGRAASTGTATLGRAGSVGPSRPINVLPTIGSQSSQPSSQGAASRRAFFELEDERKRREALEAELGTLRVQLEKAQRQSLVDAPRMAPGFDAAARDEIEQLKQQLYVAQGQAATAKRNQTALEARLHAEIDKLIADKREMEQQMRIREQDNKHALDSAKTQMVFSNHQALTSASKARQQSQWQASQRGPPGSPLHDKATVTPAPLVRSVKGKPRPPPPRFDGLNNAFSKTPTVGRTRRGGTEAPSPTTTPKKHRQLSSSPLPSPNQSQHLPPPSTPIDDNGDISMDWQPDFAQATMEHAIVDHEARDSKAELHYHLVTHVAASPLRLANEDCHEPTFIRIMAYKLEVDQDAQQKSAVDMVQTWKAGQSALASAIGASVLNFEQLCAKLALAFRDLLVALKEVREACWSLGKAVKLADIDVDVLRLFASTVLLFPELPSADPASFGQIAHCLSILSQSLSTKDKSAKDWVTPGKPTTGDKETTLAESLPGSNRPESQVESELGDAIAEAGEALCMAHGKCLWQADDLSTTVLNLSMSADWVVAARGLDLFIAAACRPDHFRRLITKSDSVSGGINLMDSMSRFLLTGHPRFSPQQRFRYSRDVLGALAMLARSDENAVVLMTEGSILVPALAMFLHRHSASLWAIRSSDVGSHDPLELITPTMLLLHHLVFPPPFAKTAASSQMHKGADFTHSDARLFASPPAQGAAIGRLLSAAAATSEFNGVQNFYVSALGPIAYTNVDLDEGAWAYAMRPPGEDLALLSKREDGAGDQSALSTVQYLAQDLLNAFVEGPEGDSVYEVYDTEVREEAAPDGSAVIVVSDDDNFDEEEAMLGTWNLDH
ncbi:hypothetical protein CC85DRAFT_286995 [Cutaneotrichosporon oleaginosum]|uniref:Uncharacterized protein n=1 Tax=Cutaneotrichosporon oleaginosum TaxID=879819 RepID=A0A0J0XID9_9TREE|nr:uncharacterized protein CC85DRAFT_286995 [Cutaneotrichosporon oleaginosum]KLT40848.1 hypothetical protein CC85DRAFT_286995 [Cutaneotrichosporon oleaginosum]TXT09292.1 hypothetical protein COLE_03226 [Cutaneotrichosporon oleaginosum]